MYIKYTFDQLHTFCCDAFVKFGFTKEEAEKITDVLLLSDVYGIESHGMILSAVDDEGNLRLASVGEGVADGALLG